MVLRSPNPTIALEACAGLALACAYSSSDEYEAEVIAVRRAAGAYGSPRRHAAIVAGLLVTVLAAVFLAV